ncbi:MAG: translation initiation factor IF-6 [Candidatus Bathyarchaeia archaeon]
MGSGPSRRAGIATYPSIVRAGVLGSPRRGGCCVACGGGAGVPAGTPPGKRKKLGDCLKVDICETNIAGSSLLGVLLTGNTNGVALPHIVRDHELEAIRRTSPTNVEILRDERTALGNLILANDYGAIVDPSFSTSTIRRLEEILQVEVVRGHIAGLPYVGSLAVATNRGVITNPSITEDERRIIQDVLRVQVEPSTVNGGVAFIRSGLLATSHGAVTGPLTVGKELMAVSRVMGL